MNATPTVKNMALPAFEIEGFRAFRDRARFELKPLTLLYGRNQAGKSTLLRLLAAIADSMYGSQPVLDLTSPAFGGASFKELGWIGPNPAGAPTIRIEDTGSTDFLEIQYTDDRGVVPNRLYLGNHRNPDLQISAAGESVRSAESYSAPYEGTFGKAEWKGDLKFASMLPSGLPEPAERRLGRIREATKALQYLQWLAVPRPATSERRRMRVCSPDGLDLADLLQGRKDVIDLASEWLADTTNLGQSLSIGPDSSGIVRLELRTDGAESLPQHLAGEGARWLLPVLLAACWAELGGEGAPTMLAVEEMEARLHPNLQIALFERLLRTVSKNVPCILETHSIYLLRRAQLAVARGELDPAQLGIYWVERSTHGSIARHIEVQRDGTLKGWNPETFEEEQTLAKEIFSARWGASLKK